MTTPVSREYRKSDATVGELPLLSPTGGIVVQPKRVVRRVSLSITLWGLKAHPARISLFDLSIRSPLSDV